MPEVSERQRVHGIVTAVAYEETTSAAVAQPTFLNHVFADLWFRAVQAASAGFMAQPLFDFVIPGRLTVDGKEQTFRPGTWLVRGCLGVFDVVDGASFKLLYNVRDGGTKHAYESTTYTRLAPMMPRHVYAMTCRLDIADLIEREFPAICRSRRPSDRVGYVYARRTPGSYSRGTDLEFCLPRDLFLSLYSCALPEGGPYYLRIEPVCKAESRPSQGSPAPSLPPVEELGRSAAERYRAASHELLSLLDAFGGEDPDTALLRDVIDAAACAVEARYKLN